MASIKRRWIMFCLQTDFVHTCQILQLSFDYLFLFYTLFLTKSSLFKLLFDLHVRVLIAGFGLMKYAWFRSNWGM